MKKKSKTTARNDRVMDNKRTDRQTDGQTEIENEERERKDNMRENEMCRCGMYDRSRKDNG